MNVLDYVPSVYNSHRNKKIYEELKKLINEKFTHNITKTNKKEESGIIIP